MKYKVGDRVRIKSIDWYNKNKNSAGYIRCGKELFIEDMSEYCGQIATIIKIIDKEYRLNIDDGCWNWIDDMFEGLVEDSPDKETKTFYFVREPDHIIECSDCLPSGVNIEIIKQKHKIFDTWEEAENHQKELGLKSEHNRAVLNKWFAESGLAEEYGYVRKRVITVETVEVVPKFKKGDKIKDKNNRVWYVEQVGNKHFDISRIPNGGSGYFVPIEDQDYYELVPDRELPKTYEACCKVLGCKPIVGFAGLDDDEENLYGKFIALKRCRDAYWKLYGEEMGLGKPWEPDWNTSGPKYVIAYTSRGIEKQWETTYCKCFAFPTEEMRDEFKENFDRDLETCKELL